LKSQIIIKKHEISVENDDIVYSNNILLDNEAFLLWYKLPKEYKGYLTNNEDPALLAVLFHAMKHNSEIIIDGSISEGLLANLDIFQDVWVTWKPKIYNKISIKPKSISKHKSNYDSGVLTFSGGVDCTYCLWKHKKSDYQFRKNIQACIFVHGFDIPLMNKASYDVAFQKAEKIVNSCGIPLIPLATNIRDLGDDWEDIHGVALASCMILFSKKYSFGMIASSASYDQFQPWGSNYLTDPLLSSNNFSILHNGAEYSRIEKIGKILDWPEPLKYLRVCWEGENDKNCCECEKCIRNILMFRSYGVGLPECFDQDVNNDQISSWNLKKEWFIVNAERTLKNAEKNNMTGLWTEILRKTIRKNKRILLLRNYKLDAIIPKRMRKLGRKIL
jgi:hypothetical protein